MSYEHDKIVPFEESKLNKKKQVEQMFDSIAPKYDALNRWLSLRVDVLWRKKVLKLLGSHKNGVLLDLATGTADLAIMLTQLQPKKVIGVDISQQMLSMGDIKIKQKQLTNIIELIKADGEALPFDSNYFNAATIAFGIRNFENLDGGLKEIYRVLQPQAKFAVLEFSKVKTFPIKQLFNLYFRYITPIIGKLFSSSNSAYQYLPQSVSAFPEGQAFCDILSKNGFKNITCIPLSFGIASIYLAQK